MKGRKITRINPGFTLVEIMVAVIILAIGILTVSQMTVMGIRTNEIMRQHMESREILARGLEVLRLLNIDDPLLTATCTDTSELDSIPFAYYADTTNIIGITIDPTGYNVYWNVLDDYPKPDVKTIHMMVYNRFGKHLIDADYVKWR